MCFWLFVCMFHVLRLRSTSVHKRHLLGSKGDLKNKKVRMSNLIVQNLGVFLELLFEEERFFFVVLEQPTSSWLFKLEWMIAMGALLGCRKIHTWRLWSAFRIVSGSSIFSDCIWLILIVPIFYYLATRGCSVWLRWGCVSFNMIYSNLPTSLETWRTWKRWHGTWLLQTARSTKHVWQLSLNIEVCLQLFLWYDLRLWFASFCCLTLCE